MLYPLSYGRALTRFMLIRIRTNNKAKLGISPNPPKDRDGRREDSGRG